VSRSRSTGIFTVIVATPIYEIWRRTRENKALAEAYKAYEPVPLPSPCPAVVRFEVYGKRDPWALMPDLRGFKVRVTITRNGTPIPDVAFFTESDVSAVFQCASDWFAPDEGGFPTIHVRIVNAERPRRPSEFDLPEWTVQRVWEDFSSHRRVVAQISAEARHPPGGK